MSVSAVTPLTILHTSDWHLGRRLYGRMRYEEFEAFLSWLQDTISAQQIDVLIVAGDIFDTMTPSNRAQALYYEFLGKVSKSCCQHIVIVAGNHDSPTFLDAPSNVLKFLNVHVIGTACEDLNDEVLVLDDTDGNPHCIIAAVPYLRDRDVRSSQAGESADSKDANVIAGICAHYDDVADIAKAIQAELTKAHKRHIPIIATGHLFALDSKTTEDDGVRDLYVGNLGQISASMFDSCFDYVALGHLHVPQRVGSCDHIRYSGSPIAMGFGEARQQKQVLLVQFGDVVNEFNNEILKPEIITYTSSAPTSTPAPIEKAANYSMNNTHFIDDLFAFDESIDENANNSNENEKSKNLASTDAQEPLFEKGLSTTVLPTPKLLHHDALRHLQVISLAIPCFQKLAQVSGDWEQINTELTTLMQNTKSVWLEVIYTGKTMMTDLRERINDLVNESNANNNGIDVLKIRNMQIKDKVMMQSAYSQEVLQDLSNAEVFERCLSSHDIVDEQKPALRNAYQEIVQMIVQEDMNSE
ncbi:exonuclease SbcCD subunit D C-terminal domain-containing protein [Psychrobacter sp.]|uniref:exonuclease SbcCD subunit D C-terminal domain-containing protein n=1 Tax=Psychrobacter sp. TaxID=56811 RepID=UPI000B418083